MDNKSAKFWQSGVANINSHAKKNFNPGFDSQHFYYRVRSSKNINVTVSIYLLSHKVYGMA